jgi:membrane-associated phospholipid phosphatase
VQGGRKEEIIPRVALAVAMSAGAGFLLLALSAATGKLSSLDYQVRTLAEHARQPFWDVVMRDVSLLGDRSGLIPLIIIVGALLWRPIRHWAMALPAVMAAAGGVQIVAKWAVDRPRPNHAAWGFPSGHVLSLVVLFGLVSYTLSRSSMRRRWQYLGSAASAGAVLTVAWSRLYLEAHWISDVAGGFMLGLVCLLLSIWLVDTVIPGCVRRVRAAGSAGPPPAADAMPMAALFPSAPAAVDQ